MNEYASKIKGKAVFDQDGKLICHIQKPILDIHNGQVLGFITTHRPHSILTPHDVFKWSNDQVIIGQYYEFYDSADIVRLDRALSNKIHLRGKKVITETGHFIGKVKDYSFDAKHMVLYSIVAHRLFLELIPTGKREIGRKQIVEIREDVIIVKDSTIKIPVKESKSLKRVPT